MGMTKEASDGIDDANATTALISSRHQHANTFISITSTKLPLNVDDIFETVKVGPFHYIFLFICGLCNSLYIMSYICMSFILVTACDLNIHTANKGWLSLCFMFGVGIGSPIFGKLSDVYGRWKTMILSVTIQLTCVIAAAFSYNYTMLLVMFFMIGVAVGGIFSISPSYAIEFFPRSYRGLASGSHIAMSFIANVYICLVALIILPKQFNIYLGTIHFSSWRIFLLVCFLPDVIVCILLFFMPESLRFVLVNGKMQDIMRTLDRMKQINLCCKTCDNSSQQETRSLLLNNLDEVENEDNTKQDSADVNESNDKLYKRPWITRCLIMGIAWMGVGFGADGFTIWLPTIVNYYHNGNLCRYHGYHNSSWSFAHTVSTSNASFCAGNKDITPVILTILYGNIAAVPFSLFLLFIINRLGRKWLFCLVIFLNGMAILLILLIDNMLSTSIISVIYCALSTSIWIPLTTWSAELFPTTIRSTAIGILHVIFAFIPGIGMVLIGIIFAHSCTITLILFSSTTLLAGLVSLFLPDTTDIDIK